MDIKKSGLLLVCVLICCAKTVFAGALPQLPFDSEDKSSNTHASASKSSANQGQLNLNTKLTIPDSKKSSRSTQPTNQAPAMKTLPPACKKASLAFKVPDWCLQK